MSVSTQAVRQGVCGISLCFLLAALGCADPDAVPPATDGPRSEATVLSAGAALYDELCAVCHGDRGQGGSAPKLVGFDRGEAALSSIIDERMPQGRPEQCRGSCAQSIARYILAGFPATQPQCDAAGAGVRRLRLLTQREYRRTIDTLFGWDDSSCPSSEFRYRPSGLPPKTVHLAGTMNGWPGTLAAGGWPLSFDAATGVFRLRRNLAVGSYQYKLVLDEKDWIADPENPSSVPDGFGGKNSLLSVTCRPKAPPPPLEDVASGLPPDARPDGFPFDDHVDARLVTPVHAEAYRRAALTVLAAVTQDLPSVLPCDGSGGTRGACTSQFLRTFGRRAFRRPLQPAEQARYEMLAAGAPSFEAGIAWCIAALLQSPHFLYRSELGEPQPDGRFRLGPYEVASALSYLYWGTMPDDALLSAAERGELLDAGAIERQARRMLADPRARAQLGDFALQWLGVERVANLDKRGDLFPAWNGDLRQSLLTETRSLFSHVVFDASGELGELFTADYSFVNEGLARLYGLDAVSGTALQRRQFGSAGGTRRGLLGHGSVLASYAHSDQTSPIRRGLLVRRTLLCQELPTPPPNAGGVPAVDSAATTRERFRQHTQNPFCKSCHQFIDGVGFGFERFDAIGRARDSERGVPIDDSGDMNDLSGLGSGQAGPYRGLSELAGRLSTADRLRSCFVRQTLRFSRGEREDVAADLCQMERLRTQFQASGYRIRDLWIALSQQPEFLFRR
ncbi:MAG TPA: DUF1592 domain-containing protein [Pseudomonadota bacterium]|nr:DUF1592 domain-containing protein [Pseudomonadota bacterium]